MFNLCLCSLVFLLKIIPNLNLSIFKILIFLCVGMVELGLCWYMWIDIVLDNLVYVYMWIDFVLYNIHLWFFWVWFSCVLMFHFLGLYDFFGFVFFCVLDEKGVRSKFMCFFFVVKIDKLIFKILSWCGIY